MTHTTDYLNKQNVIKLSLLLLLLCNIKLLYAEDVTIKKSLKLGVNYSLLDADNNGVLRLNQNGVRDLDLIVDQDLYHIDFGENQIKEPFTERELIKKDLDLIIKNIAGGEENTKKPLRLVVNTEAIWAASDPKRRKEKSSGQSDEEYASQFKSIPVDKKYYDYLVEYAKILEDNNIKWTLSIGHIPPDWIKEVFKQTGADLGHSLPVSPKSEVWGAAKPWIEGMIKELKEFIGNGKTIEEIFIINEMMFSENDSTFSEDDLKSLYLKLRGYVIDSLENNGIRDVKVSWKLVGNFKAMPTHGLSDKIMKELLPQPDNIHNEGYELTNLIGINFYEGKGLKNGNACKGSIDGTLESDTYDILTHYRDDIPFKGDIYFTEYGSTIQYDNNQQLTDCIKYSFDNGVIYWAFYKWNEIRNFDKSLKNKEIVLGLKNAFTHLLYAFPDVPISSKYSEAITELRKMGVLHGNPDGTFRPEVDVNRAEFSKMLVGLADKAGKKFGEITDKELVDEFSDLKDDWYLSYIGKLKEGVLTLDKDGNEYFKGIVHGYPDGLFHPGDTINMAEMLKMIIQTFAEAAPREKGDEWYEQYLKPAMNKIEPIWNEDKNKFQSVTKDNAGMSVTREMAAKAMYDAYSNF
jgi:hypothetical protein